MKFEVTTMLTFPELGHDIHRNKEKKNNGNRYFLNETGTHVRN